MRFSTFYASISQTFEDHVMENGEDNGHKSYLLMKRGGTVMVLIIKLYSLEGEGSLKHYPPTKTYNLEP